MSDVKELVDQYAAENQQLRLQSNQLLSLIRDMAIMFQDDKGKVRVPGKIRKQAEKFDIEIKLLKTSIVISVVKTKEE